MDIRKTRTECYLRNPKSTFELHILLSADRNRQQAFDWTIIRVIIEHIITLAPYCPVTLYHRWPGVQDGKVGSMSPLPSFGPSGLLPSCPEPSHHVPCPPAHLAFPLPLHPDAGAGNGVPGVAAMVAEALRRGPPGSTLTTPGMPPPPQSVLPMPV